jgi:hypothetical protein
MRVASLTWTRTVHVQEVDGGEGKVVVGAWGGGGGGRIKWLVDEGTEIEGIKTESYTKRVSEVGRLEEIAGNW